MKPHSGWELTLDAVAFARTMLGFEPEPRQQEVLRSDSRYGVLNCTRQWGKSTVCSIKAVRQMWSEANSLVMVISPSERQSREFVRKAKKWVEKLGYPIRKDGDNPVSLLFPNGSRMVGLPSNEDTIRSFSEVSLLLVDEASRVPDPLYLTVVPMVAVSQGRIWMMSTPKGRRGFFYDTWVSEDRAWARIAVPATECPHIPADFLESEKARGMRRFREEYMCEFVSTEDSLFSEDLVRSLIRDDVPSLLSRARTTYRN